MATFFKEVNDLVTVVNPQVNTIANRLSLRPPQREALAILATGVSKTRLMGAFISYLHRVHNLDTSLCCAHAARHGDKPWRYLLISHDAI